MSRAARSSEVHPQAPDPVSCHWVANGSNKTGSQEWWADIYAWSGAKADVSEENGTSHGLGVGLQVGSGGWSQSGTVTLDENTSTAKDEAGLVDQAVHNRVNYTGYTYACTGHQTQHKEMATSTYALLTSDVAITHYNGVGCQKYTSGHFDRVSLTNATYSTGVTLAGLTTVSAHSGWSSKTWVRWTITKPTQVCGNSSLGPDQSWKIETHSA